MSAHEESSSGPGPYILFAFMGVLVLYFAAKVTGGGGASLDELESLKGRLVEVEAELVQYEEKVSLLAKENRLLKQELDSSVDRLHSSEEILEKVRVILEEDAQLDKAVE